MTLREELQRIEYQIWKDGAATNGDRHDYAVDAILAAIRKRVEGMKVQPPHNMPSYYSWFLAHNGLLDAVLKELE